MCLLCNRQEPGCGAWVASQQRDAHHLLMGILATVAMLEWGEHSQHCLGYPSPDHLCARAFPIYPPTSPSFIHVPNGYSVLALCQAQKLK